MGEGGEELLYPMWEREAEELVYLMWKMGESARLAGVRRRGRRKRSST
jgi:hypothetical protein